MSRLRELRQDQNPHWSGFLNHGPGLDPMNISQTPRTLGLPDAPDSIFFYPLLIAQLGRPRPRPVAELGPVPGHHPRLTGILGPPQDGGDLVSLRGVAVGALGGGAHPHGAFVGLHPTQVGGRGACAVRDLSIGVVCLQVRKEGQETARPWPCPAAHPSPAHTMGPGA